eukprot:2570561-Amphidinium_carterae.1
MHHDHDDVIARSSVAFDSESDGSMLDKNLNIMANGAYSRKTFANKNVKKGSKLVPKYRVFTKHSLAPYTLKEGLPLYVGKDEDEQTMLLFDAIMLSQSPSTSEMMHVTPGHGPHPCSGQNLRCGPSRQSLGLSDNDAIKTVLKVMQNFNDKKKIKAVINLAMESGRFYLGASVRCACWSSWRISNTERAGPSSCLRTKRSSCRRLRVDQPC